MKRSVTLVLGLLIAMTAVGIAQPRDVSGEVKAKMQDLRWIEGTWTGEATYSRSGKPQDEPIQMTETARFELDGMIMVFEGKGTQDGEVVHDAYAMVTWDMQKQEYVMLAMTKDGHLAHPSFNATADGMMWRMKLPYGQVKYTIEHKGNQWHETGQVSTDGESWDKPFFEMTLVRK